MILTCMELIQLLINGWTKKKGAKMEYSARISEITENEMKEIIPDSLFTLCEMAKNGNFKGVFNSLYGEASFLKALIEKSAGSKPHTFKNTIEELMKLKEPGSTIFIDAKCMVSGLTGKATMHYTLNDCSKGAIFTATSPMELIRQYEIFLNSKSFDACDDISLEGSAA